MLRILSLYPIPPGDACTGVAPLASNPGCARCPLSASARNVCLPTEGTCGGVFVLGGVPTRQEDSAVPPRPFLSAATLRVRKLLASETRPLVFAHAVRCAPPIDTVDETHVAACRPYLARALADADPERILVLGSLAGEALLGRKYAPLAVRAGYGWHRTPAGRYVPAFLLQDPRDAFANYLKARAFETDLKHALTRPLPVPQFGATARLVETEVDAEEMFEELSGNQVVWYDTETSGLMHSPGFRIECVALWRQGDAQGFVVERAAIENPRIAYWLRLFFAGPTPKGGQNLKYDGHAVLCESLFGQLNLESLVRDVRLERKLIEADASGALAVNAELVGLGGHKEEAQAVLVDIRHDLKMLATEPSKHAVPTKTGKPRKAYVPQVVTDVPRAVLDAVVAGHDVDSFAYRWIDPVVRARYCMRDVQTTMALGDWCEARLQPSNQMVLAEITMPALRALVVMERHGLPASRPALEAVRDLLAADIEQVLGRLRATANDANFNPASRPQLLRVLQATGICPTKTTKAGGISTDDQALERHRKHPFVANLLRYRELTKLISTYVGGWLRELRPDGCMHTSYLLDGAESGRPSSANPNLSNCPRAGEPPGGTPEGTMLRNCVIPPPGWVLFEGDLKQAEIRKAADMSGDPVMQALVLSGRDFHTASSELFAPALGKDPNKLTKADRQQAKTSTFACLYELPEPERLGRLLAMRLSDPSNGVVVTVAQGTKIAEAMFGQFKRLRAWMKEQIALGQKEGGVWTTWRGQKARFRPLWDLGAPGEDRSPGTFKRENAQRATYNSPIQGSSADHVTAALWPFVCWCATTDGCVIPMLTIYDSITALVREDWIERAAAAMDAAMTAVPMGNLPVVAEYKISRAGWGSMVDWPEKEKT